MKKRQIAKRNYKELVKNIGVILGQARKKAFQQVDRTLVNAYWEIGRHIVVYEQENNIKADYGSALLDKIAHDLKQRYGRGFSRSNVFNFRRLYLYYPKIQSLPGFLSWTHIIALLSVEETLTRSFYEKECIASRWSTRELQRQINSIAVTHRDIGQMNLYLNYFKKEEMAPDDNEPIGIVLGTQKDHVLVEYALGGISNKLFASKYRLSLPDKRILQKAVERIIAYTA